MIQIEAKYDVEVDVLRSNWSQAEIEESDAVSPGVIIDYDAEGNAIGIEILNASQKIQNFNPALSELMSAFSL